MRKRRTVTGGTRKWRTMHPLTWEQSVWFWCVHCEHVFDARTAWEPRWSCPSFGCDGMAIDAQAWEKCMAKIAHPEYPAAPVDGGYYPAYEPADGKVVGEVGRRRSWRPSGFSAGQKGTL